MEGTTGLGRGSTRLARWHNNSMSLAIATFSPIVCKNTCATHSSHLPCTCLSQQPTDRFRDHCNRFPPVGPQLGGMKAPNSKAVEARIEMLG
eukprot:2005252-Amphidinium_carterae.1